MDVRLVNPLEAKKRMAGRNKTDERDAQVLAMLLRIGTLPRCDLRGLLRTRLALRDHTTTLKSRIHGAVRRYGARLRISGLQCGRCSCEWVCQQPEVKEPASNASDPPESWTPALAAVRYVEA